MGFSIDVTALLLAVFIVTTASVSAIHICIATIAATSDDTSAFVSDNPNSYSPTYTLAVTLLLLLLYSPISSSSSSPLSLLFLPLPPTPPTPPSPPHSSVPPITYPPTQPPPSRIPPSRHHPNAPQRPHTSMRMITLIIWLVDTDGCKEMLRCFFLVSESGRLGVGGRGGLKCKGRGGETG